MHTCLPWASLRHHGSTPSPPRWPPRPRASAPGGVAPAATMPQACRAALRDSCLVARTVLYHFRARSARPAPLQVPAPVTATRSMAVGSVASHAHRSRAMRRCSSGCTPLQPRPFPQRSLVKDSLIAVSS
ncbi:hypothetical protein PsYK624_141650 [Phanerochaete sordida]|uniref:Uncharacterized protein n=1 Tax=Phanerochaete sordida TaxID=48140 RepID=A0A9P3GN18_9APHY|nr:hypothetical protein PsYK624_141650 [Phanerochaete sordida]